MNRRAFFDAVRADPFKGSLGKEQVSGMEGILDAFVSHGDGRAKTLAYALATAYHEVGGRMVPVREGFAKSDAAARRVVRNRKYGVPAGPYNHVYYGRGLVQLTWLENYERSSADAGANLVKNPDAALDPVIGARLLIRGLIDGRWNGRGKGIACYLTDKRDDLKNARRTVNITDKWELIGGYYRDFLSAIEKASGVPTDDGAKPDPAEQIPEPPRPDDPGTVPNMNLNEIPQQTEPDPPDDVGNSIRTKPASGGFSFGRIIGGVVFIATVATGVWFFFLQ